MNHPTAITNSDGLLHISTDHGPAVGLSRDDWSHLRILFHISFAMLSLLSLLALVLTTKRAQQLMQELRLRDEGQSSCAGPRAIPTAFVAALSLTKHIPLLIATSPKGIQVVRWFFHIPLWLDALLFAHACWSILIVVWIWIMLLWRALEDKRRKKLKGGGRKSGCDHCRMTFPFFRIVFLNRQPDALNNQQPSVNTETPTARSMDGAMDLALAVA